MAEVLDQIKNSIVDLGTEYSRKNQELAELLEKEQGVTKELTKKNEELDSTINALAEDVSKLRDTLKTQVDQGVVSDDPISIGEAFVTSKEYKAFLANPTGRGTSIEVSKANPFVDLDPSDDVVKAVLGEVAHISKARVDLQALFSSGLFAQRMPDVHHDNSGGFHFANLFTQLNSNKSDYSWVEYFGYSPNVKVIQTDVAAGSTAVVLDSVHGLSESFAIILTDGTNKESFKITAIDPATNTITLDHATTHAYTTANSSTVRATRLNRTGTLGRPGTVRGTLKGGLKPTGNLESAIKSMRAVMIASLEDFPLQDLEDHTQVASMITNMMRLNIPDQFDDHSINGNGTEMEEFLGLLANNNTQSITQVGGQTTPDVIRLALANVRDAGAREVTLVANDLDIADVDMLKDSTGRYMRIADGGRIWNVKYEIDPSMPEKKMAIGDYKRAGRLIKRGKIKAAVAYEHSENFARNMVTFRVEQAAILQWVKAYLVSKINLI